MRFSMKIFLTAAVLFLSSASCLWAWTAEERAQFQKANDDYRAGQFREAISLYEGLSKNHPYAAALYYNLGDSYFRAGELSQAILAFERARLLEPRNQDILKNLSYVRGLLEYRIEDKRNWYIQAGEKMLEYFTEQEIGFLWMLTYALLMMSWVGVLFLRRGSLWGWPSRILLVLTVLFFALFAAKQIETRMIRNAIVTAKTAEVRYGPAESDQVAFRLGGGLTVYVVDRRPDWSRVTLVNGEGGWVKNSQIAEVRIR
jgi:tetratricopeptide (TPR) repeat protein